MRAICVCEENVDEETYRVPEDNVVFELSLEKLTMLFWR